MNKDRIIEDINKLSIAEKLFVIGEIWDNINAGQKDLPVTECQKIELKERLENYEAGKEKTKEWSEVKEKIRNRYE